MATILFEADLPVESAKGFAADGEARFCLVKHAGNHILEIGHGSTSGACLTLKLSDEKVAELASVLTDSASPQNSKA